jgi:DDE superfamily endonuclease
MKFIYVMLGWEGSASDSRIWGDARENDLRIPEGKYYLGDTKFPSCDSLLIPYCGVCYHLREWDLVHNKCALYLYHS